MNNLQHVFVVHSYMFVHNHFSYFIHIGTLLDLWDKTHTMHTILFRGGGRGGGH